MAIPSSGPVSFSDLATEWSDPAGHSLSEFYRGGSLVEETIPGNFVPGNPYSYPYGSVSGNQTTNDANHATIYLSTYGWSDYYFAYQPQMANPYNITYCGPIGPCNVNCGGVTHPGSAGCSGTLTGYANNPPYTNPPVSVNTNVPTSGAVSLSDFYDAQNY